MYMLQQRQFLEATSSGDGDVLAQGRGKSRGEREHEERGADA